MKTAQLLNRQQEVVGSVTWMPPGAVQVDIADASIAAGVRALIVDAQEKGLPLRSGGPGEHGGQPVLVERTEMISVEDERFLAALVAALNRASVAGQRLFGVLEPREEHHA
jgi:hypothetical protein